MKNSTNIIQLLMSLKSEKKTHSLRIYLIIQFLWLLKYRLENTMQWINKQEYVNQ